MGRSGASEFLIAELFVQSRAASCMATNRESYNIPARNSSPETIPTFVFAWHSIRQRGKIIGNVDANVSSCHLHKVKLVRLCWELGDSWALLVAQQYYSEQNH